MIGEPPLSAGSVQVKVMAELLEDYRVGGPVIPGREAAIT
jgi:hypothetical protein